MSAFVFTVGAVIVAGPGGNASVLCVPRRTAIPSDVLDGTLVRVLVVSVADHHAVDLLSLKIQIMINF